MIAMLHHHDVVQPMIRVYPPVVVQHNEVRFENNFEALVVEAVPYQMSPAL